MFKKYITTLGAFCLVFCIYRFVHAQVPSQGFAQLIDIRDRTVIGGFAQNLDANDFMTLRYTIPGALDTTYNPGGPQPGVVLTSVDDNDDVIVGLALDLLQRIVFTGTTSDGVNPSIVVGRYTNTGQLDTTFNPGGTTPGLIDLTEQLGSEARAAGVVIDSNRRIVVAGTEQIDVTNDLNIFIARFLTDGSFDTTFGNGAGFIQFSFFDAEQVEAVAVDDQNRILVAGSTTPTLGANQQVIIARFNEDGTLDEEFGQATSTVPGAVLLDLGSASSAFDIKLDSIGRILAVGAAGDGFNSNFFITRLLENGDPDEDFNSAGSTPSINITGFDNTEAVARSLAIDRSGRSVVTGFLLDEFTGTQFMTTRYTEDGELDETFGAGTTTPGSVLTTIEPSLDTTEQPRARGAAVNVIESILPNRPSYRVVTSGFSFDGNIDNVTTIAYTEDGQLDETFNPNGDTPGIVITQITAGAEITQDEFQGGSMYSYLEDAHNWPVDDRLLRQLSPAFLYPSIPWIASPLFNAQLPEGWHTVTGFTHPYASVKLFANGTFLGSVVSNDLGEWAIQSFLPPGRLSLAVSVFDPIAKLTYTSAPVLVIVESVLVVPKIAFPLLGAVMQTDGVRFSGTGKPGNRLQLVLNGELLTEFVIATEGEWLYVPTSLPPGEYHLDVVDLDQPKAEPYSVEFSVVEAEELSPEEKKETPKPVVEELVVQPEEKSPEPVGTEIIVKGQAPGSQVNVFLDHEHTGAEKPDQKGAWRHSLMFEPTHRGEHRVEVGFDAQPTTIAMQRFKV